MINIVNPIDVMVDLFELLIDRRFGHTDWTSSKDKEKFKAWGYDTNVGIHFCLEIRADNFGYEKDGSTHHPEWEKHVYDYYHVIILSGHRVYAVMTKKHDLRQIDPKEFKNMSNHDSEWRHGIKDPLFTRVVDMWDEAYAHVPLPHRQKGSRMDGIDGRIAPRGQEVFNLVRIERAPLPEEDRYFDQLVKIKKIKFKIQLVEE